jgi:hypothetical protein
LVTKVHARIPALDLDSPVAIRGQSWTARPAPVRDLCGAVRRDLRLV